MFENCTILKEVLKSNTNKLDPQMPFPSSILKLKVLDFI